LRAGALSLREVTLLLQGPRTRARPVRALADRALFRIERSLTPAPRKKREQVRRASHAGRAERPS